MDHMAVAFYLLFTGLGSSGLGMVSYTNCSLMLFGNVLWKISRTTVFIVLLISFEITMSLLP
jgi:hypothetical protein